MFAFLLKPFSLLIKVYQRTLSPDHGLFKNAFPQGVCRFHPTCSQYALEAIEKHQWIGFWLIIKRIFRCHPFSSGGHDPVPSSFQR
jgi:uncharacterized protein